MPAEKTINISINSKVLATAALGAGVLLGASTAYLLTRIHEHSNLTRLVSNLHATIKEVKEDLANIENELGILQGPTPLPEETSFRRRHRKVVSFSSTTSSTYKTADIGSEGFSYKTAAETVSDAGSWKTAPAYDTDYFSPDEDDDEFFDISPTDDESEPLDDAKKFDSIRRISEDVSDFSCLLRIFDSLIDSSVDKQLEAYDLLMEKGSKYESNAEILWRKAKAARNLALIEEKKGNMEKKRELLTKGYEYASQALQVNDTSAEVHKWFAILSGCRGDFLSTRERIESGQDFKKHIDIALQISPNDSTLHHLLGRFCYEVSLLSWVERKVASALFGEVPSSSFEEALEHFTAAEELKPDGWKENRLYIARCYLQKQRLPEAEIWLRRAREIPTVTADDELVDQDIDEIKNSYSLQLS